MLDALTWCNDVIIMALSPPEKIPLFRNEVFSCSSKSVKDNQRVLVINGVK